jgi:hypothetical protein
MVIIQQNKLTKESHEESLQTLTNICENVFKIITFTITIFGSKN